LTATPERMDGENILDDFVVVLPLKLPEALNKKIIISISIFWDYR
jgi:superfamily II DNA or RNA helicase